MKKRPFNLLLIAFVFLFLVAPIFGESKLQSPLVTFLFMTSIVYTLKAFLKSKPKFYLAFCLAGVSFVLTLLVQVDVIGKWFALAEILFYLIFVSMVIYLIVRFILSQRVISADTIKAGVCVYLLLGLLWSSLYMLLYIFETESFRYSGNITPENPYFFIYYSFTVITTLGFGDVVPNNTFAINLSMLEAICGQMYIAIFVASIVSVYITQNKTKKS